MRQCLLSIDTDGMAPTSHSMFKKKKIRSFLGVIVILCNASFYKDRSIFLKKIIPEQYFLIYF